VSQTSHARTKTKPQKKTPLAPAGSPRGHILNTCQKHSYLNQITQNQENVCLQFIH